MSPRGPAWGRMEGHGDSRGPGHSRSRRRGRLETCRRARPRPARRRATVHEHRAGAGPGRLPRTTPSGCAPELGLVTQAVRAALADGGRCCSPTSAARSRSPSGCGSGSTSRASGGTRPGRAPPPRPSPASAAPASEPSRPYWSVGFLEPEEPRLLEILYEINRRHLDEVERRWPGDGERRCRLSLFREGELRRLRLGPAGDRGLGARDVATPWEGPAAEILADLAVLRGSGRGARRRPSSRAATSRTATRRSPSCLSQTLGSAWAKDPECLAPLETLAFEPSFRGAFRRCGARTANGWARSCERRPASRSTRTRSST